MVYAVIYTQDSPEAHMTRLHLHMLSDSTGETLEMIAKAALAQFEGADVHRHFWPMVRSRQHLDRVLAEIAAHPGLVLFTLVNTDIRARLEERCRALTLPMVDALDAVTVVLEDLLGVTAKARPGRQHMMDEAYFKRVDAIHFTIAHDDGVAHEDWEQADIVLAGVSRTSKNPYLDLSRQPRIQSGKHSNCARKPAAAAALQTQASLHCRADDCRRPADSGAAQPAAVAQSGARNGLCRFGRGGAGAAICPPDVCR